MPAPVVSSGSGGVRVVFTPPLEFIAKQAARFRMRLYDLEPLWARFAPIMSEVEREQFNTHGHGDWPELADSTLDQKARYGWPIDPLVRTGELKMSLMDPGTAMDAGPDHMSWGTDVEYAGFHQDGGSVAGRPPQRKVIDIRTEDRRKFEAAMVGWINQVAAEVF